MIARGVSTTDSAPLVPSRFNSDPHWLPLAQVHHIGVSHPRHRCGALEQGTWNTPHGSPSTTPVAACCSECSTSNSSTPINIYTMVLIVRGGLETITSEFSCINLTVSDIFICFFCLFYVLQKHIQVLMNTQDLFLGFLNISRPLFQGCICVERYLAVVHPVTFLRYKLLRYKIMYCSVVWFITLGFCIVFLFNVKYAIEVLPGLYTVIFSLMFFCCVSVLWALKQPNPGEGRRQ